MQTFIILLTSVATTALLGIFPTVRSWWRAFIKHPATAIIFTISVLVAFTGVSGEVDVRTLEGLPDRGRLIRAGIMTCLFVYCFYSVAKHTQSWKRAGQGLYWMLAYALLAMLSATYSTNPVLSLYKGYEVLVMVLVAITISGRLKDTTDTRWFINITSLVALFMVITILVGLVLYPAQATQAATMGYFFVRGIGLGINPAVQGAFAGLLLASAMVPLITRERTYRKDTLGLWLLIIASVAVILLARNRTQLAVAAITAVALLIFSRRVLLGTIIGILGAVAILFTAGSESVHEYILRGQEEEDLIELSGRLDMWTLAMSSVLEDPFLGKGFYAAQKMLYGRGSVDNTLLEATVGLGLAGLTLLLIPLLWAAARLIKMIPNRNALSEPTATIWLLVSAYFAMLTLRAPTSPTFASYHAMMIFYLTTQACIAALYRNSTSIHPATFAGRDEKPHPAEDIGLRSGSRVGHRQRSRILRRARQTPDKGSGI